MRLLISATDGEEGGLESGAEKGMLFGASRDVCLLIGVPDAEREDLGSDAEKGIFFLLANAFLILFLLVRPSGVV